MNKKGDSPNKEGSQDQPNGENIQDFMYSLITHLYRIVPF